MLRHTNWGSSYPLSFSPAVSASALATAQKAAERVVADWDLPEPVSGGDTTLVAGVGAHIIARELMDYFFQPEPEEYTPPPTQKDPAPSTPEGMNREEWEKTWDDMTPDERRLEQDLREFDKDLDRLDEKIEQFKLDNEPPLGQVIDEDEVQIASVAPSDGDGSANAPAPTEFHFGGNLNEADLGLSELASELTAGRVTVDLGLLDQPLGGREESPSDEGEEASVEANQAEQAVTAFTMSGFDPALDAALTEADPVAV